MSASSAAPRRRRTRRRPSLGFELPSTPLAKHGARGRRRSQPAQTQLSAPTPSRSRRAGHHFKPRVPVTDGLAGRHGWHKSLRVTLDMVQGNFGRSHVGPPGGPRFTQEPRASVIRRRSLLRHPDLIGSHLLSRGRVRRPSRLSRAGVSCFVVVGLASVSLATRGQADMRGLVTAGRCFRLERVRVSGVERRETGPRCS